MNDKTPGRREENIRRCRNLGAEISQLVVSWFSTRCHESQVSRKAMASGAQFSQMYATVPQPTPQPTPRCAESHRETLLRFTPVLPVSQCPRSLAIRAFLSLCAVALRLLQCHRTLRCNLFEYGRNAQSWLKSRVLIVYDDVVQCPWAPFQYTSRVIAR